MDIGPHEIYDVVHSIWETLFGWDIQQTPEEFSRANHGFRTGIIRIGGAWEGAVVCISSELLVRQAGAVMCGMTPDRFTIELLDDALGELTNMIGGNLKALLPEPCYLCLPTVVEGSDYSACVPAMQPRVEMNFTSQEQPFSVKLLEGGYRPAASCTKT